MSTPPRSKPAPRLVLRRLAYETARLITLDGSRASCDWGSDPDAIVDGVFGPSNLPRITRRDYVENSNDSYWLANARRP